jgi:hypothetical protein
MRDQRLFLSCLRAMDAGLVAAGMPPLLDWWWDTIERFYLSGARRFVIRKGRRVYASTSVAPRVAVAEMLFGEHKHIKGTPAIEYAFLSVKRDEANKRLDGIKAILEALEEPYVPRGQTLVLTKRPAVFVVVTASHKTAVGGTIGFAWCDEVARWSDDDTGKNPAEQVVGTLAPALATLPDAKLWLVSSPLVKDDFHARSFELGDTDHQATAFGATWDINPTLTEEETHKLEPDLRIWSREYAAIPSDAITADWFGVALDMALSQPRVDEPILSWVRYTIAIDPAFSKDFFGYAVISSRSLPPDPRMPNRKRRMTRVHEAGAWKVNGRRPLEMAFELRKLCQRYHVGAEPQRADETDKQAEERIKAATARVFSDQFEGHSFGDLARQAGLYLEVRPWTGGSSETSQGARYKAVRLAMLEGTLLLPSPDAPTGDMTKALESELRGVRGVLLPSGAERIELPRSSDAGHMDRTSALVLAASEALLLPPQEELVPPVKMREQDIWREQAKKACIERRQREWRKDPMGALRRASR